MASVPNQPQPPQRQHPRQLTHCLSTLSQSQLPSAPSGHTQAHPLLAARQRLSTLRLQFDNATPDKEHFAALHWGLDSAEQELHRDAAYLAAANMAEERGEKRSLPPIGLGAGQGNTLTTAAYRGWKKYEYGGKKKKEAPRSGGSARPAGEMDGQVPLQGLNPMSFVAKKIR